MNKKLKMYYADLGNMGDQLNSLIVEELFGYRVTHRTYLTGKVSGIGSGLGQFTLHGNIFMRMAERVAGLFFPDVTIWGTGFIEYKEQDEPFYRKKISFAAVRGELSKKRVEKILGRELDIPTGDAGILAPCIIHEPIKKKYDVGIIPHMNELGEDMLFFEKLAKYYNNSIIIKVTDDPKEVVRTIGECKAIVSSSLHGLIVADGFHIPNCHIVVTQKLRGDGFKFDDYYSAYGVKHEYIDLNKEAPPSVEDVIKNYKLSTEMVEKKKRMLIDRFPMKGDF